MTNKKKRFFAVAFLIWLLGFIYLGSKALDEFRSGEMPFSDANNSITLKNIMFPTSKSWDQE